MIERFIFGQDNSPRVALDELGHAGFGIELRLLDPSAVDNIDDVANGDGGFRLEDKRVLGQSAKGVDRLNINCTYHVGSNHNLPARSLKEDPFLLHSRENCVERQYFDFAQSS